MKPAPSIVFFTVASGAGYGLLFWLGLLRPIGLLPSAPAFALVCLALALLLITAGLISSTLHLGNPGRAWRAFSQWRSSWLSREGVVAVLTYIPALLMGYALLSGAAGLATLADAQGFFEGDLVEGVDAHLDAIEDDAAVVGFDADTDVVVHHAFDAHHDLAHQLDS